MEFPNENSGIVHVYPAEPELRLAHELRRWSHANNQSGENWKQWWCLIPNTYMPAILFFEISDHVSQFHTLLLLQRFTMWGGAAAMEVCFLASGEKSWCRRNNRQGSEASLGNQDWCHEI